MKKEIAITGFYTILAASSAALPLCLWYDSLKVKEHNDRGRKEAVYPLVKNSSPTATLEKLIVFPVTEKKNCPATPPSEAVEVFLEQKFMGNYCLGREIDEAMRKKLWEASTPMIMPYKYHAATQL